MSIEDDFGKTVVASGRLVTEWRTAARSELQHGWGPDVLAVVSGVVLGILSNASYDLIKKWLLSRKKRQDYEDRYHLLHYERVVVLVVRYFEEHPEIREEIAQSDLRAVVPEDLAGAIDHESSESGSHGDPAE